MANGNPGPQAIDHYRLKPGDLDPQRRLPGISAFMRIKNGADFLETTIRSHIDCFDEIVALYNQCTDATPQILARLAAEYGPKLRVYHYLPAVHPPGSAAHASEPEDSPRSLVHYYNVALALTRHRVATKLDDDHLAIRPRLQALTDGIRRDGLDHMLCFTGLNLVRVADGRCGILAGEPFSGTGDIGFFPVRPDTIFTHDRRFERFQRGALRRRYGDMVYWHLKFLKPGHGFAAYAEGGALLPRYQRKQDEFLKTRRAVTIAGLQALAPAWARLVGHMPLPERLAFRRDRWRSVLEHAPAEGDLAAACAAVGA